jgi:hypothetical protein
MASAPGALDGSWIDAIVLAQTVGLDILYGFFWAVLADATVTPVPGNAATQTSLINAIFAGAGLKIKIVPIGFSTLENGGTWAYGATAQNQNPLSAYGTMRPFEVGYGFFKLFYDNVPFSTGGYFSLDASAYNDANVYTTNQVLRFNTKSTNGLLPYLMPTLPYTNGGALTKTQWNKTFSASAGFDYTVNNPYNPGGRAPVLGV